jgi:hypothetical protein
MSREDIQSTVYDWAVQQRFTAPYGILAGKATTKSGRSYRSVTFGYARTRDFEVQIYGPKFIVLRDSRDGNTTYTTPADLMADLSKIA